MQIIDTHCHYNLEPLVADWKTAWHQAQAEGVIGSVVIGTDVESSQVAIEIAEQDPRLLATAAIHPGEFNQATMSLGEEYVFEQFQQIATLAVQHQLAGIGETGLDYFHIQQLAEVDQDKIKSMQQLSLTLHLALASRTQLPLILHVRDTQETAYWDTLRIIKDVQFNGTFILHCVSGPLTYIQEAIERGAYISAAGNMTYASAHHLREIVKMTPPDKLLLETDAPFLPPVPHRGKTCEPWMIRLTADYLEKELQVDLNQCLKNSYTVFPQLQLPTELQ